MLDQTGPRQPWDRRANESPRAFGAFSAYRSLGPSRSLRKLAARDEPAVNRRQVEVWSAEHGWVDRAAAWDDEVDRQVRIEQLEAVKEMRRRHSTYGLMAAAKAIERIRALDVSTLTARDAIRLLQAGVTIEREARGEPTELAESPAPSAPIPDILEALRRAPQLIELADSVEEAMAQVYDYRDADR